MRLGILSSHPIQYQSPWFRALAREVDLEVFFAHRQTAAQQGQAGFGVAFEWDVDLLCGYRHRFLKNMARRPGVNHFAGCDTPEIRGIIREGERPREPISRPADTLSPLDGERAGRGVGDGSRGRSPSQFDAFIVMGWNLKSFWQAVRACRRARVPVLVRGDSQLLTPRSTFRRWAKEVTYGVLLRQFDGFLFVGQRNREYLRHYGVPETKLFFAPHFVDNEWFRGKADNARKLRVETRKEWGADNGTLVVLFVGKFQAIKRPGDILQALVKLRGWNAPRTPTLSPSDGERVAATPGVPNLLAVFVGSGELEKELHELAEHENLRVHFAGFKNQSELPRYYTAADVLVLPSESETWGLVVNEAMACGLPAIVSDAVGCAPNLIEEAKTGFTFARGDTAQLAQRLTQLNELRQRGHDFAPALAAKLQAYSLAAAVDGTLQAVRKLATMKHAK